MMLAAHQSTSEPRRAGRDSPMAWIADQLLDRAGREFSRADAGAAFIVLAAEQVGASPAALKAIAAALGSRRRYALKRVRAMFAQACAAGIDAAALAAQLGILGASLADRAVAEAIAAASCGEAVPPRALRLDEIGLLMGLHAWPGDLKLTTDAVAKCFSLNPERARVMLRALVESGRLRRVFVRKGRTGRVHYVMVEDPEWPANIWPALGIGEPAHAVAKES
jgi:hypothetical protein